MRLLGRGASIRHHVSDLARQARQQPDCEKGNAGSAGLTGPAGARVLQQNAPLFGFWGLIGLGLIDDNEKCLPVASRENVTEIQTLFSVPTKLSPGVGSRVGSRVGTDRSRLAYTSFLAMTPRHFFTPRCRVLKWVSLKRSG